MNPLIDQTLDELIANGAVDFKAAGLLIWMALAIIMILWTGLKTVVSRKFDTWEILRLVVALGVSRTMLALYRRR